MRALVQRARDSGDRRIMRVTLSPAGQARLIQLKAVIAATDEKVRAVLLIAALAHNLFRAEALRAARNAA